MHYLIPIRLKYGLLIVEVPRSSKKCQVISLQSDDQYIPPPSVRDHAQRMNESNTKLMKITIRLRRFGQAECRVLRWPSE
jgi:hypothetical protein